FDVAPGEAPALPLAQPIPAEPVLPLAQPVPALPLATPLPAVPVELAPPLEAAPELCPSCASPRKGTQAFCGEWGYMDTAAGAKSAGPRRVPVASSPSATMATASAVNVAKIKGRYELRELINERAGICRYRGVDHAGGTGVTIVWSALPEMVVPLE